jgi:hypothetical protein
MSEERILDFLDGNLGASEEEELLHRLAVSPERRNLLKQHLQMRELTAALARTAYVPVPKVVTASLFTTLAANGYAGPSMPGAAESLETIKFAASRSIDRAAENIIASRSTGLFTRSSVMLVSIVSFFIGAAVLYFVMPGSQQHGAEAPVSSNFRAESAFVPLATAVSPASSVGVQNNSGGKTIGGVPLVKSFTSDYAIIPTADKGGQDIASTPVHESDNAALPVISAAESKYPPAIAAADIHGSNLTSKNPFDGFQPDPVSERTFLQRLNFSFRAGEGKAPGNEQALTGSLMELKASYDISDLFVAKVSIGDFMPYETQAVTANPQFNRDGFRLLQLSSVLQYRAILGAEIGAKFNMFSAPFELSAGFISDLQGTLIPRLGFFTSLELQDNLSMNIGLEGMIYKHDIGASLQNAQAAYAGEHPLLVGQMKQNESTGFIGPAIEMVWHF